MTEIINLDEWRDGGLAGRTHSCSNHALHYGSQVFEGEQPIAAPFLNHASIHKGYAHLVIIWFAYTCSDEEMEHQGSGWPTIILLMVMCGLLLAWLG